MSERAGAGTNKCSLRDDDRSGFVTTEEFAIDPLLQIGSLGDAGCGRVRRDGEAHAEGLRPGTLPTPHRDTAILKWRVARREAPRTFENLQRALSDAAGGGALGKSDDHQLARESAGDFVIAGLIFDINGTINRDWLSGNSRRERLASDDHPHRDWLRAWRRGASAAGGERQAETNKQTSTDHQGPIFHALQRLAARGQES